MILFLKKILCKILCSFNYGYTFYYKKDNKISSPHGTPHAPWYNTVLTSSKQVENAILQVKKLGLPLVQDRAKNWDALAALDLLLKHTNRRARIFDAGSEYYSKILPWLFLYRYKKLIGGNIAFNQTIKKGPIKYEYADVTNTKYKSNYFNAVTCLSVIEHGVNLEKFFIEMHRILKPNGFLVISTDYFENKINTKNLYAYGAPVKIFSKKEIVKTLKIANKCGLYLKDDIDLSAKEKVVHWERFDLKFTFILFVLFKQHNKKN